MTWEVDGSTTLERNKRSDMTTWKKKPLIFKYVLISI